MSKTVTEIVKVVAPAIIQALADGAKKLVSDDSMDVSHLQNYSFMAADSNTPGDEIYACTSEYITTHYWDVMGYRFKGKNSQPKGGKVVLAASMDLVCYGPSQLSDLKGYLQKIFVDAISDDDAQELSDNLTGILEAKFGETDFDWTPFYKTYNFADTIIDTYMVTAPGQDNSGNKVGLATYCFVAYPAK
jgi:hypothetical protein